MKWRRRTQRVYSIFLTQDFLSIFFFTLEKSGIKKYGFRDHPQKFQSGDGGWVGWGQLANLSSEGSTKIWTKGRVFQFVLPQPT